MSSVSIQWNPRSSCLALEQEVLGRLLCDPREMQGAISILSDQAFQDRRNAVLWHIMCVLHHRGDELNGLDIAIEADNQGRLEEMGGLPYVVWLIRETGSTCFVLDYCERLRLHWLRGKIREQALLLSQSILIEDECEALRGLLNQYQQLL